MLKKLKIVIGGQVFEFEGEVPFPATEVFKFAGEFLHAILNTDQAAIDALTKRAKTSNDKLATAVETATS